jgi:hypothetical protein
MVVSPSKAIIQVVKKSFGFIEPKVSSPSSQRSASGQHPEPVKPFGPSCSVRLNILHLYQGYTILKQ